MALMAFLALPIGATYLLVRRRELRKRDLVHAGARNVDGRTMGQIAEDVVETLTRAAGLPPPAGPPPLVHYVDEIDVQIYSPRRVGPLAPP